jgi:hypothetical protein
LSLGMRFLHSLSGKTFARELPLLTNPHNASSPTVHRRSNDSISEMR